MTVSLDTRSFSILNHVVDAYVETQEPVGSRFLSKRLGMALSAATIRNVMADLEEAGLLFAPHTSAGRLPTEAGMRLCLDAFLTFGDLSADEQASLDAQSRQSGKSLSKMLEDMTLTLSGLAQCAGLVFAPKSEGPLKHVEFVLLSPGKAMVILITSDSLVENRIIDVPENLSPSDLTEASNYLNHRLVGKRLNDGRKLIFEEIASGRTQVNDLADQAIAKGLASWDGQEKSGELIVRGQVHLLSNVREVDELKRLQTLFSALDTQQEFLGLLDATIDAEGVQVFIGSENPLFEKSGCSMVIAPYRNSQGLLLGAIGVIGPTYMNYRRIAPMVDYTARLLGRIVG
jgi:heat-inducible transcriptional repressor